MKLSEELWFVEIFKMIRGVFNFVSSRLEVVEIEAR